MIADAQAPENAVQLEERLAGLQIQRAALHARIATLDGQIADVQALVGEAEERVERQTGEYARLHLAAGGRPVTFGARHRDRTVLFTSGGQTQQLSGPRPLATAEGQADHARRRLDALEIEAAPIRSTLSRLQREREQAERQAALIGGEIGPLEVQLATLRTAEQQRAELIGERLGWRERLAQILRRPWQAPSRSVQELRAEGKSIREIEAITGISKSEVQRQLSAAVPAGTPGQTEGA